MKKLFAVFSEDKCPEDEALIASVKMCECVSAYIGCLLSVWLTARHRHSHTRRARSFSRLQIQRVRNDVTSSSRDKTKKQELNNYTKTKYSFLIFFLCWQNFIYINVHFQVRYHFSMFYLLKYNTTLGLSLTLVTRRL